ncbi:Maf family nucleotide pyrophosphatase [Lutibacter sp.]|uniref:Maf family nucleotide pyrophosphatase n=1 Tax=Lutibacter sp. TaxID=1925666 RepID=UPI00273761BC|nr:Maf family nucleotide pyrophosphatase [Lutibacter sp.]MDP3313221.1 Maf family nucleotide pyrophosphatase [Lutibacter sp.]
MLQDKFKNQEIILATASPRRQELFRALDIPFKIKIKSIEENYSNNLKAEEITNYLAKEKAIAFENEITENQIIITADTIVWFDNGALEKPINKEHAKLMLQQLSGKSHQVFTSICIKTKKIENVFFDETLVFFKEFSATEIEYYVDKFNTLDKAGGYGIQEWIGYIGVTRIEGSYYNVMGLPVHKLYEELLKL